MSEHQPIRECRDCARLFAICVQCPEPVTATWCPCASLRCGECAASLCRYCGCPASEHTARGCRSEPRCGEYLPGGHHPAYTRPEGAPRL